jgi:hypothetical protein
MTTTSTATASKFIPALPFYSLKNAEEVSRTATKELLRVTTWLEENMIDQATRVETQQKEKVMGKNVNSNASSVISRRNGTNRSSRQKTYIG